MLTPAYTTLASAINSAQQADLLLTANPPYTPDYLRPLILYVGGEAIQVTGSDPLNAKHMTLLLRGYNGTDAAPHSNGSFVIMGLPVQFSNETPNGSVLSSATPPVSSPRLNVLTGDMAFLTGGTFGEWEVAPISAPQSPSFARTPVADVAYTALPTDFLIAYTALTAARAVTLPAANLVPLYKAFIVKDEAGTAGTTNITVTATIDGAANKVINANYGIVRVYSNGTNWFTW